MIIDNIGVNIDISMIIDPIIGFKCEQSIKHVDMLRGFTPD